MTPEDPPAPGATIGIMGGGQLGRMTALAAARLGYRCHIFAPEADGPAEQVSAAATIAAYTDATALDAFAGAVDVVTFEFENVPHESVRRLAERVAVYPRWDCLRICQDRLEEKDFLNRMGVATAPYRGVTSAAELTDAVAALGRPCVLKTRRFGYDGKGQVAIDSGTDLAVAWRQMGANDGVLEGFIDFEREISVIVARNRAGVSAAFNPVENRHRHHILHTTLAPAHIKADLAREAVAVAERIAETLDLVGLLAVEMFVTRDGRLLVNELAPRPHNSGHWTIDACPTSQFEQFVRAVLGLPLGSVQRHSDALMTNLIGEEGGRWADFLREPGDMLHMYGKAAARPGRKMGHVTRLYPLGRRPDG